VLFVWAVAISSATTNHRVREAGIGASAAPHELEVREHFDKWIAARERKRDPEEALSVVLVAAGRPAESARRTGLRRCSRDPGERACLRADTWYAISGVSGGERWRVVSTRLLAQDPGPEGRLCDDRGKAEKSLERCAAQVNGQDFLSRRSRHSSFRTWSALPSFRVERFDRRGRSRRRGRTPGGRACGN